MECFVKVRAELQFFLEGKNLPGFKDLDPEDKEAVTKALPAMKPVKPSAAVAVKRKNEDQEAGPSKKSKKEDSELEKKIQKQNKEMYGYIDRLKKYEYTKRQLSQILSSNKQEVPVGVDEMQSRIGDIMTFGALKPCTVCEGGQYVYRSGVGYQCLGHISEYTKCMFVTQDPERVPFKVPNDFKEEDML